MSTVHRLLPLFLRQTSRRCLSHLTHRRRRRASQRSLPGLRGKAGTPMRGITRAEPPTMTTRSTTEEATTAARKGALRPPPPPPPPPQPLLRLRLPLRGAGTLRAIITPSTGMGRDQWLSTQRVRRPLSRSVRLASISPRRLRVRQDTGGREGEGALRGLGEGMAWLPRGLEATDLGRRTGVGRRGASFFRICARSSPRRDCHALHGRQSTIPSPSSVSSSPTPAAESGLRVQHICLHGPR
jgi:hypothetical protein